MNNRERILAILNYQFYDKMPVLSNGYWRETVLKWIKEGHVTNKMLEWDGEEISRQSDFDKVYEFRGEMLPLWYTSMRFVCDEALGFDGVWGPCINPETDLFPRFPRQVIETAPNGQQKVINSEGQIVIEKPDTDSIPGHIGTILTGREAWEKLYLPKLQFSKDRIDFSSIEKFKNHPREDMPMGVYGGSMFGTARNWLGVEGVSYLYADDEDLYDEILDTLFNLSYNTLKTVFETGIQLDFIHMWEDICFKNGPLVVPGIFEEKVGPHYEQISSLARQHGVKLISLDSDGLIDSLIPTWFNHGINTMFPIEVGTWGSSIEPWRKKYGQELRGLGGMDKRVFAQDYSAIDREIERLSALVELGGYIPFPDHAVTPDAIWENVQYYCDRMHTVFG